jgi:hypothetical protein
MQEHELERLAQRRLPELLRELLAEQQPAATAPVREARDAGVDLRYDDEDGRTWLFQVKATSGPASVLRAAERLRGAEASLGRSSVVPVLVVPYMTSAGARAAEEARVNWLDLSGNASVRAEGLRIRIGGRENAFRSVGRPSSPFAPRSARVARTLLLDPLRWWRQRDLVQATRLDDSQVSRAVGRLRDEHLLATRGPHVRPISAGLLLEAWSDHYRFRRHDIVMGHVSGSGIELARRVAERLVAEDVRHAFTGLAAAWAIDHFAAFRLTSVYVAEDPRDVAERIGLREGQRGANAQLVGPDDVGVFAGAAPHDGLTCVSPAQVYLDLQHLPERAHEAADHLWARQEWTYGRA